MNFIKLIKLKDIFVSFCISLLLSSLLTFFFLKTLPGKTKINVILKEYYKNNLFLLVQRNPVPVNFLEGVRLEYFIKGLADKKSGSYKHKLFIEENDKNTKIKCKDDLAINYVSLDNKSSSIQIVGKKKDIDDINLCISTTLNFINNSINQKINNLISEYNSEYKVHLLYQLPNEPFITKEGRLFLLDFINIENKFDKNPIKILLREEITISRFTDFRIFFITIFMSLFFMTFLFLLRKKIFIFKM